MSGGDTTRRNVMRALAAITTGLPTLAYASPALVCIARPDATAWDRLVEDYRAATAAANAHPYGSTSPSDPRYDAISVDHAQYLHKACRALDAVMEHPVTDNAMLAEKLEIAVKEFGGDNFFNCILADAQRLAEESLSCPRN